MATFGKTTDGASFSNSNANKVAVSAAVPSENGVIVTGHAQLRLASAGPIRFAIYADSGGAPGALLAESDIVDVGAGELAMAWRTIPFSGASQITVTAGTTYWIGPAWQSGHSVDFARDATDNMRLEGTLSAWPTLSGPTWAAATQTGPMAAYVTTGPPAVEKNATDTATSADSASLDIAVLQAGSDAATTGEAWSADAELGLVDDRPGTETPRVDATLDGGTDSATTADAADIIIPAGDQAAEGPWSYHVDGALGLTEPGTGGDGASVETLYGDLIVSLHAIDPATGSTFALPDYAQLDVSRERNGKGAVSFTYPTVTKDGAPSVGFDRLRAAMAGQRDLEFELRTNGTADGALRGLVQEGGGNDVAEGAEAAWAFAGSFDEWRFDEAVVFPQDRGALITDPDTGEQAYSNAKREFIVNADNPGEIMLTLLEQAQDRGALAGMTWDFSTTHDSNGTPWPGVLSARFSPGVTYTQILTKLVELNLAEWAVVWNGTARVLKLWAAGGRGVDRTVGPRPVVLRRGRNLLDAARKHSVRESATTVLAAGSEGVYADATDPTALARRGRVVEAYSTLGSASDEAAVLAFAQAELEILAPGFCSIEHGIGMLPGEPRPVIAYDIGDWVLSQTGTTTERLRVVQWTLKVDTNRQLSGTTSLNDTVQDMLEKLRKQQAAIASGEAVVGTSDPGPQIVDRTPPAAPEGVVASSKAYQDPQATGGAAGQTLSWVEVGWLPVTTNADGADSPLVQAAQMILDKMEELETNPPDPEDPDPVIVDPDTWTWEECPQVVRDFAAPLRQLWVDDGSPAGVESWLMAYVAEASQTPTVAQDVEGYHVRYSYLGIEQVGGLPSSDPFPEDQRFYYLATPPTGTSGTSFAFGGVEGGSRIRIEVSAFDRAGNQGAWTSIALDTQQDTTPPPVPSGASGLKTMFRTLLVPWDGLGAEGEPMPVDFSHARVWVGQGADMTLPVEELVVGPVPFDPVETGPQYVRDIPLGAGTAAVDDLPIGVGWYACLQAVDYTGNASARSAVVGPVTAQQLVNIDIGPDAIDRVQIIDGEIVRAKIADAAINSAKVEELEVGKLTAGTMTATVVLGGSFWTSLNPAVNRMGFSGGGLQMYRGAELVGEWKVSDGSMLVTGTYRSGTSGPRIHINPNGSMDLYPTSGTNKSTIANENGEMVWRGPLASSRSGRLNVNSLGVGLNYSQESNLLGTITSELVVLDKRMRLQAPLIQIIADQDYDTHDGTRHRVQFNATNSSGSILSRSGLSYGVDDDDWPGFFGNDTGLKWAATGGDGNDGRVICTGGTLQGSGILQSGGVDVPSSGAGKTDIEDARALIDPLEAIRNARARKFRTVWRPDAAPQVGVIAEELPEALQRPMVGLGDEAPIGIELSSQIGVLWGAIGQILDQEIVSTSGTVVLLRSQLGPGGIFPAGATAEAAVTWDSAPPAAPTGGFAQLHSSFIWAGKVTAWIKTGSVTAQGCTVVFKNISSSTVVVNETNDNLRVSATVIGLGLYTPPYVPPEEAA